MTRSSVALPIGKRTSKNMTKKNWTAICEAHIWGYRGALYGQSFDVVRFYEGDWRINYGDESFNTLHAAQYAAKVMALCFYVAALRVAFNR
jgi:hypothetical protein